MLSTSIASQGYLNRILLNNTRVSCLRLNTWHLPVSDVRCHSRTTWPFASLVKPNHQRSPLVSDVFRTESCHLSDIESRYLPHIRITKSCHLYYVRFTFCSSGWRQFPPLSQWTDSFSPILIFRQVCHLLRNSLAKVCSAFKIKDNVRHVPVWDVKV